MRGALSLLGKRPTGTGPTREKLRRQSAGRREGRDSRGLVGLAIGVRGMFVFYVLFFAVWVAIVSGKTDGEPFFLIGLKRILPQREQW
jgi:hypothetical protein